MTENPQVKAIQPSSRTGHQLANRPLRTTPDLNIRVGRK